MLFCLTINPIVSELLSDLVLFYLDDGTIAGDADSVLRDFEILIEKCNASDKSIEMSTFLHIALGSEHCRSI